jgi:2-keto-4-pentenoate hydratase/2-oxohepta-3-ene-1,7-dioic acid hydratase in catechol pathway
VFRTQLCKVPSPHSNLIYSHAKEAGVAVPKYPVIFYKPVTALASPTADIPVCGLAQVSPELDYECELVIIIGKQGKDISEENALEYVLGYAVGNDVSHRGWQLERGGGQWGTGKMFDGWAPISGAIVSPEVSLFSFSKLTIDY